MATTVIIDSISQAHEALGLPKPQHPLVSMVYFKDIQHASAFYGVRVINNLYQVMLKSSNLLGTLHYGRNSYDFQEGTLVFMAPGQRSEFDGEIELGKEAIEGWSLAFHPDLIRKYDLGEKIANYSFFSYEANEALHVSEEEKHTIEGIIDKIIKEYSQNLDQHSHHLIVANIQLLLDYCIRFYDRQFYTRATVNHDVVAKFERLLKGYYETHKMHDLGVPTVQYCAEELSLSSNYLSDLLKKETGKSTQEHIHLFVIEKAKNSLLSSTRTVSEIAYSLGFDYPQHFSSLFKSKTGFSPRDYRNLN
ncbi:MAG: helix-turn-helix domain-containing protein [Bacteroidota bacterium]